MSEKLTVAELLARSGRTASSGGRRRRRSLDEGGISVAELTGSIPVVEAADIEKAEAERAAAAENDAAEADAAADGTEIVDRTEASEVRPEEQTSEMQAVEEPASPLGSVDDAPRDEAPAEEALAEGAPVEEDAVAGSEAEAPVEHAEPARTSPAIDETTVLTKVTAEHLQPEGVEPEELYSPAPHQGEDLAELERSLGEDEVIEYEDDTISWPAMIVQAVLAVAVGVGVFLIFGQLWERLSTVIMLGLALVATLALVGVIHALLRHRDKLIMLLAFVVGLVLTLGPRLILGL